MHIWHQNLAFLSTSEFWHQRIALRLFHPKRCPRCPCYLTSKLLWNLFSLLIKHSRIFLVCVDRRFIAETHKKQCIHLPRTMDNSLSIRLQPTHTPWESPNCMNSNQRRKQLCTASNWISSYSKCSTIPSKFQLKKSTGVALCQK